MTMRRLGDALAVEAMAIYHHFPRGKEQLLDALVEHVAVAPVPATTVAFWRDRLLRWAYASRDRLVAHPGLLPLVLTRDVDGPAAQAAAEARYAALREAGLRGPAIAVASGALVAFVQGHAALEIRAHLDTSAGGDQEPGIRFDVGLEALLAGLTGTNAHGFNAG